MESTNGKRKEQPLSMSSLISTYFRFSPSTFTTLQIDPQLSKKKILSYRFCFCLCRPFVRSSSSPSLPFPSSLFVSHLISSPPNPPAMARSRSSSTRWRYVNPSYYLKRPKRLAFLFILFVLASLVFWDRQTLVREHQVRSFFFTVSFGLFWLSLVLICFVRREIKDLNFMPVCSQNRMI